MKYLSLREIVKLKFSLKNEEYDTDFLNKYVPNFRRNCNNKLKRVNMQLEDFKPQVGNYKFSRDTAEKLIQLEECNLGQSLDRFENGKYDVMNAELLNQYFLILENLIKSHFNQNEQDIYLSKIQALKIDSIIYKKKYTIVKNWFKEDDGIQYLTMMEKDLSGLFVDIHSITKYPYLTEMDRVSLVHELYTTLTGVLSEHLSDIYKVQMYRSSDDPNLKDIPIDQIIAEM